MGTLSRSADYTIQGFIYQFNKTLLEILNDEDDSLISIEGIIEDIEIATALTTRAIQCKYHEEQEKFTLGNVYKPILQMMEHYFDNIDKDIEYKLYAHFPNESEGSNFEINEEHIKTILQSRDQRFQRIINKINGNVDIPGFLKRFTLEFGASLQVIIERITMSLERNGLPRDDIDTLFYPNAIQMIADLSILHEAQQRIIKKSSMLEDLQQIRKTAITRWTRSLRTLDRILTFRRKQLKTNLDKNSRLRYLFLSQQSINNFNDEIVNFISDFVNKYHFKEVHDKTPLICIDCSQEVFKEIRVRLHKKNIRYNDGLVTDEYFDKNKFLTGPVRSKIGKQFYSEFQVRLLRYDENEIGILNQIKSDDFFLFTDTVPDLDFQDVNVEHINLNEINQIKFVMGMVDTYE
ncbi:MULTISPECIES: hypothetical protein [Paenibacillus]|uniref:hypothetical protein n=1 Tax=Paenibacillus TaxID=44249 RepID=UPI0001789205|nr:hypothetical protein [Paenibacillus sp. Y412MC10]ACX68483.1 conserved hypothetical protein [Paenibacillus sp. Y412MC10]